MKFNQPHTWHWISLQLVHSNIGTKTRRVNGLLPNRLLNSTNGVSVLHVFQKLVMPWTSFFSGKCKTSFLGMASYILNKMWLNQYPGDKITFIPQGDNITLSILTKTMMTTMIKEVIDSSTYIAYSLAHCNVIQYIKKRIQI